MTVIKKSPRMTEKLLNDELLSALRAEVRNAKKGGKTSPVTDERTVDQEITPVAEETPLNEAQTNQGAANNPEPPKPEVKPQVTEAPASGEPSIYDIARNKTAEDAKIKDKKPQPEAEQENEDDKFFNKAEEFNNTSSIPDDPNVITKESLKLRAKTRTEITDAICVACFCIISMDWEFQNMDRWRLKPERKQAITQAWYAKMLETKKLASAGAELWWLLIGSYGIFLIMAIATIFRNFRLKREAAAEAQKQLEQKQREKKEQEKQNATTTGEHATNGHAKTAATTETPGTKEPIDFKPDPRTDNKPKRPGPHKQTCDFIKYKGKKSCNCK